ncbi:MAG: carbohydrate ABC transporter permease [Anaerolineae bacterium]
MPSQATVEQNSHLGSRRRFSLRQREAIACALFVAPAVFGFVAFSLIPLLASAVISFTNYSLAGWPRFVGWSNYGTLFTDPLWWQSVKVTAIYALAVVPLWLINSLILALLMNQNLSGINVFRTIYYLPAMLSGVAISMLWIWLLRYHSGLINNLLQLVGIQGPNWLGDGRYALLSIIIMSQWSVGWYLPIWLGGLQAIPTELYEAVSIDGGGRWTKIRHVTLPMLSPIILYNAVMNIIWATQLFTEPFMMTGGGPQNTTLTYMLYLYRNAFTYSKMGLASAMAWLLFLVVLVLTIMVFKSSPLWVYYEAERNTDGQ